MDVPPAATREDTPVSANDPFWPFDEGREAAMMNPPQLLQRNADFLRMQDACDSLHDTHHAELDLRDVVIRGKTWRSVRLERCKFSATTFSDTTLTGVAFELCELRHITFERCSLIDCRFTFGRLAGLTVEACDVLNTHFAFCSMSKLSIDPAAVAGFSSSHCRPRNYRDEAPMRLIGWQPAPDERDPA